MRGVPVAMGSCFLLLGALGAWSGYQFRVHGAKATAKVLGSRLDHEYRATNYRRHEPFYWVHMEFVDGAGRRHDFELKDSPDEAEAIQTGSNQEIVYIQGHGHYALDDGHVWIWGTTWAAFGIPLGLFLIGYGIWGKVPSYPR